MIQKLKMLLVAFSSFFILATPAAAYAAITQTDINGNLCSGSNGSFDTGNNSTCSSSGATDSVSKLITTVVNVLSIIVGAVAVIMIIVGGFRYITSAGNPEGAKSARNTILYAIIGLVVVALAQLVVHFVLNKTTNATT